MKKGSFLAYVPFFTHQLLYLVSLDKVSLVSLWLVYVKMEKLMHLKTI